MSNTKKTANRTRGAFGPRNAEHKLRIEQRQRERAERIRFIWQRENAPSA